MTNARLKVVRALSRVRTDKAYSNLVLDDILRGLEGADVAFAKRLFSGTLEKSYRLEYILSQYTKLNKLPDQVVCALLVALYQLMYMNSVPYFSAINESVNITKKLGYAGLSGLVNGTLRNIQRKNYEFKSPTDFIQALAVEYSVPKCLVKYWVDCYGMDSAEKILIGSQSEPPLFLYVNTIKTSRASIMNELLARGLSVTEVEHLVRVDSGGAPQDMYGYDDGLFFVQDLSASMAVEALAPQANENVLDMCSAPGGKSFATAIKMGGTGKVLAMDLHEHRLRLVKSGAKRLGLKNLTIIPQDATVYNEDFGGFDRVICDVPCSGYGTLRRKPEVRYKNLEDCNELPKIQFEILCNGIKYLKKHGKILYSTCTLNPAENENVVNRAIEVCAVRCIEQKTIFPSEGGGDGFFYAVLEKQ